MGEEEEKGENTVETKVGDIFKSALDEADYIVKKIVNRMVVLESQDGEKEILTDASSLKIKSFYQKKESLKRPELS